MTTALWRAAPAVLAALIFEWGHVSAIRALDELPLPVQPMLALAIGAAVSSLALFALTRSRGALWLLCLAMPAAMLALVGSVSGDANFASVVPALIKFAVDGLWSATGWAIVAAIWIGVPIRRLPAFAAVIGLKGQALLLGFQLLLPGLVLILLFPLIEILAARGAPGFLPLAALRAVAKWPIAWLVSLAASILAVLATQGLPLLGGSDALLQSWFAPPSEDPFLYPSLVLSDCIVGAGLAGAALLCVGALPGEAPSPEPG